MGNFSSTEPNRFPLKIRKTKKYGWIPDIPDQRDIWTSFPPPTKAPINTPATVDLRKTGYLPEIWDQGPLGSSVAHATLAAWAFDLNKADLLQGFVPSRQFMYYNQRVIMNTVGFDSGASIRDAIKILNRIGVCSEEFYPYDPSSFTDRPIDDAWENATKHQQVIQYRRIRLLLEDILKSLSIKHPVIFGFTVYESFEHPDVARTGIMPVPKLGEKIVGAHCVLIVGYDSQRKFLLCRNSWGTGWGQGGYFWMPFAFINSRNCQDFWILSTGAKEKVRSTQPTQLTQSTQSSKPSDVRVITMNKAEAPKKESRESIIEKVPDFKRDNSDSDIEEDATAV